MNAKSTYSYACAAFAAAVAVASLAGCFSEHVAITPPTGEELCSGIAPANVVRIQDFAFSPAQVTVAPGGTVIWVNCGTQQHSSTADGGAWDSGLLPRFTTFERRFDTAGNFPFHCTPHPFMQATVVVQ